MDVIDKYLARYAEPEVASCGFVSDNFQYCLVIPAYQETWLQVQKVWGKLDRNLLIILVANAPDSEDVITRELIDDVKNESNIMHQSGSLTYLRSHDKHCILLVDRCHHPIPRRQGVGLARKIGADIALSLITTGRVRCPFIFNTDADVELPVDYFSALSVQGNVAAAIYPFTHRPESATQLACYLYEISLLYYSAGLRYAQSPYAFHNIGSTLIVSASHYAQVRGFPGRNAGEDFYLLNKLAKTGRIVTLKQPELQLSGRFSDRVAFGTGTGIEKIHNLVNPERDLLFYNPRIFVRLRQFLAELKSSHRVSADSRFSMPETNHWCEEVKLQGLINEKQKQRSAVFLKFTDDWMDAFRTLKFVHFMREHYDPSLPLQEIFDGTVLPCDGRELPLEKLRSYLRQRHSVDDVNDRQI